MSIIKEKYEVLGMEFETKQEAEEWFRGSAYFETLYKFLYDNIPSISATTVEDFILHGDLKELFSILKDFFPDEREFNESDGVS